jgi:HEAT repeat protein
VIAAGFTGDLLGVEREADHEDAQVRIAVLNAKSRLSALTVSEVLRGLNDHDARVRRRALELSSTVTGRGVKTTLIDGLINALSDEDPLVVDGACWAIGERQAAQALEPLCDLARNHSDPRCREAAVAALGAIGDEAGLATIILCLDDKPNIRRRVVVALASFEGEAVDQALDRCRVDHDWQVRQAVEMLERTSPLA